MLCSIRWCLGATLVVAAAIVGGLAGPGPAATREGPATDHVACLVLFKRQLLSGSADYGNFTKVNETAPRAKLRQETVAKLKALRAASQEALDPFFKEHPEIEAGNWYWVVNALAAVGPRASLEKIAAHPEVREILYDPEALRLVPDRTVDRVVQAVAVDPVEEGPLDLTGVDVPWNLEEIGAKRCWTEHRVTGRGVVVAVMDTPWCYTSPAMKPAVWRNPGEIPGNGIDDDGNGFTDDIHGWSFVSAPLHTGSFSHGLACAGIIAGRPAKGVITGVAPRARVMLLAGGASGALSAIQYAIEMKADLASMSFMNRSPPPVRALWRLVCEQATAAGLLLGGGAGNFGEHAKVPEQIWSPKDVPCVLCAAGVRRGGGRPPYSSQGPVTWENVPPYRDFPMPPGLKKPDFAAFPEGYPVQFPDGPTVREGMRGNSFSGPHAMGVAALVLEAAPELTPWKVQRILCETAKDLFSPGWDAESGWGLLDAGLAVERALKERR